MVNLDLGNFTLEDEKKINELDLILEKDPLNISALLEKGFIFHEGCLDEEAIKVFKEILKIEPKNLKAYIWLCESLYMLGDYPQLQEVCQQVIKIYPDKAVFYRFLAESTIVLDDSNIE